MGVEFSATRIQIASHSRLNHSGLLSVLGLATDSSPLKLYGARAPTRPVRSPLPRFALAPPMGLPRDHYEAARASPPNLVDLVDMPEERLTPTAGAMTPQGRLPPRRGHQGGGIDIRSSASRKRRPHRKARRYPRLPASARPAVTLLRWRHRPGPHALRHRSLGTTRRHMYAGATGKSGCVPRKALRSRGRRDALVPSPSNTTTSRRAPGSKCRRFQAELADHKEVWEKEHL